MGVLPLPCGPCRNAIVAAGWELVRRGYVITRDALGISAR